MARLIHKTSRGTVIEYDTGTFDDWCVYVTDKGNPRFAPTDVVYFSRLSELAEIHGHKQIYDDFVVFYDRTNSAINPRIMETIVKLSAKYGADGHEIEKWFVVIYAGMVAEENKKFAILKKRIKRLGMHQVLVERKPPAYAAKFSKGKKWRKLDAIMKTKGF